MQSDPIADDELILRHIPGGTTFQAAGPRITSKNFVLRNDRQETGISVSRAAITPPSALTARLGNPSKGSRIAAATAGAIRALGLEVVPDPLIPDDLGHAEIRSAAASLDTQEVRKKLAMLFQFVEDAP